MYKCANTYGRKNRNIILCNVFNVSQIALDSHFCRFERQIKKTKSSVVCTLYENKQFFYKCKYKQTHSHTHKTECKNQSIIRIVYKILYENTNSLDVNH